MLKLNLSYIRDLDNQLMLKLPDAPGFISYKAAQHLGFKMEKAVHDKAVYAADLAILD